MTSAQFDFAPLLPAGLPAPAAKWTGLAKYSFVGGNNDPDQVPVDALADAVNAVLRRVERDELDVVSLAQKDARLRAGRVHAGLVRDEPDTLPHERSEALRLEDIDAELDGSAQWQRRDEKTNENAEHRAHRSIWTRLHATVIRGEDR